MHVQEQSMAFFPDSHGYSGHLMNLYWTHPRDENLAGNSFVITGRGNAIVLVKIRTR
jgi:hypothetical protein